MTGATDTLTRRSRGTLKLYIGSAAGVGKTYRMLQEAHELLRRGEDVVVGFAETHRRVETEAQLQGLEIVPRRRIEYRTVVLEEMDVDAIIARAPAVALVDELPHSNAPTSRNMKRWQDVMLLLDEGIGVISAMNIQHLESLNAVVERTLGVYVRETVPDRILALAREVVNVDISVDDLRQRVREGRIYGADRIETSLANFFTEENLTTLRELALREVASAVDRSREAIILRDEHTSGGIVQTTVDRLMVCLSSNPSTSRDLLRKASRIAGRLNSDWYCVYVQTSAERADRIDAATQRQLVESIQFAQSLGAEPQMLVGDDVVVTLATFAAGHGVTIAIVGNSRRSRWHRLWHHSLAEALIARVPGLDVMVAS